MEKPLHSLQIDPKLPLIPEFNDKIMSHLASCGLTENQNGSYPLSTKDFQIYTLYHKQAYIAITYELCGGGILPSDILHDTDKLVLYGLIDWKNASGLHKDYSSHHYGNISNFFDIESAVIDYECARFTKADKPLNAYETIMQKRPPESHDLFKPVMEPLGLWNNEYRVYEFKKWKEMIKLPHFIAMIVGENCRSIKKLTDSIKKDGFNSALTDFNKV